MFARFIQKNQPAVIWKPKFMQAAGWNVLSGKVLKQGFRSPDSTPWAFAGMIRKLRMFNSALPILTLRILNP